MYIYIVVIRLLVLLFAIIFRMTEMEKNCFQVQWYRRGNQKLN